LVRFTIEGLIFENAEITNGGRSEKDCIVQKEEKTDGNKTRKTVFYNGYVIDADNGNRILAIVRFCCG